MSKVWKDHPMFGKRLTFVEHGERFEADVIDVKPGPMLLGTSAGYLERTDAVIRGTIKLRIKPVDSQRAAFWTPPMEYKPEPQP